ncbi:MAG: hypothetical protein ACREJD_15390 [Phycisphaerales bacterium]
MKTLSGSIVTGALVCLGALVARADNAVVPSSGNGVDLGSNNQGVLSGNAARRYQLVIDAQALTGIPIGSRLDGYRVRLDNSRTLSWPASDVTIADYEVRISAAATTAATMSTTYASNISGVQTLVKDGALNIAANSYSAGATGTTPENFGPPVLFDTGFLYLGGSLCIDINYTGTGLASEFMDASSVAEGMAGSFATSRTATTGAVANGTVMRFEYTPPSNAVVPAAYASASAPSGQEGPLSGTTNRRFQYVVDEAALGIPAGAKILGMVFRLDQTGGVAAWPPAAATFSDYEVRLSQGVATGAMTSTYASNVIGTQKLVVDGALTLNAGTFQDEETSPTPEQFGRAIMFETPYQYLGGNLCVDINHPGTGLVATDFLDAPSGVTFVADGVRGLYSSVSRTAATGTLTNAPVTRFIYAADLRNGVTKVFVADDYASAEAPSQLNSLTNSAPRSVMTVASANQFDTIAPGSQLIGYSGRLGAGFATWPAAQALFASYTIDVSRSVNPPGALSTTFASNVGADVVHAYADALVIPANAFATAATNAPFSHTFWYQNPYSYTGGPLNVFVRHSGNLVDAGGFLDAIPMGDPAFGTRADCLLASSSSGATGNPISATVLRHEVNAATMVPLTLGAPSNAFYNALLRSDTYVYQAVISGEQLRYIPPGSLIDSMWIRNFASGPSSPAADSICPDFELTLSTASTNPTTMSTVFANNEGTDAVLVHNGPLAVAAGTIPAGSTGTFARLVKFEKAFVYKGGALCVTLRHQKFTVDVAQCEGVLPTLPDAQTVVAVAFDAASGIVASAGGAIAGSRFGYVPSVHTPNSFATVEASNGFDFLSRPSTIQFIVPADELRPVDVGSAITGVSFRNSSTGGAPTRPEAALSVGRFDVTLAPSAQTPLTMSNTFALNNGPGVVTVRSGPMVIPAGAFPATGDFNLHGENEWFVDFDRAFVYPGGDLCLTIRSTATLPDFTYLDTDGTGPTAMGAARWNDGNPDAAASTSTLGAVAMRFAFTVRAFCPWDLNNDGAVDDGDFPLFLQSYNILDCKDVTMPFGCPADFNHDGVVDDVDFQAFIVAYNELVCP